MGDDTYSGIEAASTRLTPTLHNVAGTVLACFPYSARHDQVPLDPSDPGSPTIDLDDIYRQYLIGRSEFVHRQGWFPTADRNDADRFDSVASAYAVAIDGSFGVRLTRIRSLHDALSWEMCTPGMRERLSTDLELSDALGAAEAGGTLFDLTRLVVAVDDTAPHRRELLRLRQLLVAALTHFILDSIDEDDNGALWIFATTPPLSTMLRHIGITHTIHAGPTPEPRPRCSAPVARDPPSTGFGQDQRRHLPRPRCSPARIACETANLPSWNSKPLLA